MDNTMSDLNERIERGEASIGGFTSDQIRLIQKLLVRLQRASSIPFGDYKQGTLLRRLRRRLDSESQTLDQLIAATEDGAVDLALLAQDLLVDVTEFFRDPEMFASLESTLLLDLLTAASSHDKAIRIWVPGCATGQEAYSLAMLCAEARDEFGDEAPTVSIFATDVHASALAVAAAGWYRERALASVSIDRRNRFFQRREDGFQVTEELRSLVTFARHELLNDAPFTQIDLVSCRNLLIYFSPDAQLRAIRSLNFALRTGGILVLGPSESLTELSAEYTPVDNAWRVFQKTGDAGARWQPQTQVAPPAHTVEQGVPYAAPGLGLRRAYDALLESSMVGGLLVDSQGQLVHTIGTAHTWVKQPSGRATLDAVELIALSSLRLTVSRMLRSLQEGAPTTSPRAVRIPGSDDGEEEMLWIEGRRIDAATAAYYLISTQTDPTSVIDLSVDSLPVPDVDPGYVHELEDEVELLRRTLQQAVTERNTWHEELNATNQELNASNEELRSSNEELSALNEELRTLNDEHRERLEMLTQVTADLEQLMSSTDIGVIFLTEDRRIRRFNEPARDYFRIREADISRDFEDVRSSLDYPELRDDIDSVFSTGERHVRRVGLSGEPERQLVVRVDRYDLALGRWGVFVAIVDITSVVLADQEKLLASFLQEAPARITIWDDEHRGVFTDGITPSGVVGFEGRTPDEIHAPDLATLIVRENREVLSGAGPVASVADAITASVADADDRVVGSKFRFSSDGQVFVGSLGIPESVLAEVAGIRSETAAIPALIKATAAHAFAVGIDNVDYPILHSSTPSTFSVSLDAHDQLSVSSCRSRAVNGREFDSCLVRDRSNGDGGARWFEFTAVPVDDERIAAVCIWADVDEQRKLIDHLENDLAQLHAQIAAVQSAGSERAAVLAERNRDLDNFAHVAAHDLKSPIRSIRSFSELALQHTDSDSEARQHLEQVISSSIRMSALVDSLLDFAAIGREEPPVEPIDLRELIEEIEIDLRVEIEETAASITLDTGDVELRGSREGIRQVMTNLVHNALKYRAEDPPHIRIVVRSENEGLLIRVEDNGIGFDGTRVEEVFEPFKRLHATSVSGSGVGLAICRRIVQRHGGRIWATSFPGQGATFNVWLPTDHAMAQGRATT